MTKAQLIEDLMQAPPERYDAIHAAACGATPKPRPITIRQAAEIGTVTPRTIQRYADMGLLHPIKITARRVRYDLNEVDRLFTLGADAVRRA